MQQKHVNGAVAEPEDRRKHERRRIYDRRSPLRMHMDGDPAEQGSYGNRDMPWMETKRDDIRQSER